MRNTLKRLLFWIEKNDINLKIKPEKAVRYLLSLLFLYKIYVTFAT